MGMPIAASEAVVDDTQYHNSISQVPQGTWNVMGAAFQEALTDNPINSIYRLSEMANLKSHGEEFGDIIAKEDFDNRYASLGLKWDDRMTWSAANELGARKIRERQNQFIMGRGQGGAIEGSAVIGSALVASFLDPVNVLMAFLPVVSAPKYAQLGARVGSRLGQFMTKGLIDAPGLVSRAAGGSTWARLQIGAIDGFAGSLVIEPLVGFARTQEQADYTTTNFFHNVMIGTFMGAGLHAGFGKIGDLYSAHGMRRIEADIRETESAAKQLIDGKSVDTVGLHAIHEAEITRLDESLNVNDKIIQTEVDIRALDLGELPAVEVVNKSKAGVEVRFIGDKGHNMTAFGKNIETAQVNLIREYQRLKIEERSTVTKKEASKLQGQLENFVSKRNQLQMALRTKASSQDIDNLVDLRDRLKRLNSPEALDIKLRERGLPVDTIKFLDEKLAALDRHRKGILKGARGKKRKLPKIEDEEKALQFQRDEAVRGMEQGKFTEAKELLRRERDTIRKQLKQAEVAVEPGTAKAQLKKVNKQIDDTMKQIERKSLERTQETLSHQQNHEGRLFFTKPPDVETMAAAQATTRASDISEVDKALKKVDDQINEEFLKDLPEDIRKSIEDTAEVTRLLDTAADAQRRGIECMAGLANG